MSVSRIYKNNQTDKVDDTAMPDKFSLGVEPMARISVDEFKTVEQCKQLLEDNYSKLLASTIENIKIRKELVSKSEELNQLKNNNEKEKLNNEIAKENEYLKGRIKVFEKTAKYISEIEEISPVLESKISELHKMVIQKDSRIRTLENQLMNYNFTESDLNGKKEFHNELLKKIEELRDNNLLLNRRVRELDDLKPAYEDLKTQYNELEQLTSGLNANKETSSQKDQLIDKMQFRMNLMEDENNRLTSQLRDALETLEKNNFDGGNIIEEMKNKIISLFDEKETQKKEIEKISKENEVLNLKVCEFVNLKNNVETLEEEKIRLSGLVTELKKHSKNIEGYKGIEDDNSKLKMEIEDMKGENKRLQRTLKETNEKYKLLDLNFTGKNIEAEQLFVVMTENERLQNLLIDISQRYSLINREKEEACLNLGAMEKREKSIREGYEQKIKDEQESNRALSEKLKEMLIRANHDKIDSQEMENKGHVVNKLQDEVRALTNDRDALKRMFSDLNDSYNILNDEICLLRKEALEKTKLIQEIGALKKNSGDYVGKIEGKDDKIRELEHLIKMKDLENSHLNKKLIQNESSSKKMSELETELTIANEHRRAFENKAKLLPEVENKLKLLALENARLQDLTNSLKETVNHQLTAIESYQKPDKEVKSMAEKLSRVEKERDGLVRQKNALENEVSIFKDELKSKGND